MEPSEFAAPDDRLSTEAAASALGQDPAQVAAWDRLAAGAREFGLARDKLALAFHETAGALGNFVAAWNESEARISAQEAEVVAAHPDLAEVNVRLDALYEAP